MNWHWRIGLDNHGNKKIQKTCCGQEPYKSVVEDEFARSPNPFYAIGQKVYEIEKGSVANADNGIESK